MEEVAGISVYEMRKTKSLKELERTDEKLKQVNTVLRERTNYLKNLENEREQALRFKKLQLTVKRCKASIINRNVQEKQKELNLILNQANSKKSEIEKKENHISKLNNEMDSLNKRIDEISKTIQKSSGFEQDTLLTEISELKQEIAGLTARKENFENQLLELDRRKEKLEESIKIVEKEIAEMIKEKGKNKKKELEEKKSKLEEFEESKRKFYLLKSDLSSVNSQSEDKKRQLQSLKNESNFILNQIEQAEKEIKIKENLEEHNKNIHLLNDSIETNKKQILKIESEIIKKEKDFVLNSELIEKATRIKSKVSKLDICPLCRTKMTKEHIQDVITKAEKNIEKAKKIIQESEKQMKDLKNNLERIREKISQQLGEVNSREIDIIKIQTINEKKQQLNRNNNQLKIIEEELKNLENKKKSSEKRLSLIKLGDEQHEILKLEINELQRSEERNLGGEITLKQRELERTKIAIKQNLRDKEDTIEDLKDINDSLEEKQEIVEEKESHADVLREKYQKMFEQKNSLQDKIRVFESDLLKVQNEKRLLENEINNLNITKAQIIAKKDTFVEELKEFENTEFLSLPIEKLKEKLESAENILDRIGNVNLRALEVYDDIKEEYEKIKQKVEQLDEEKQEILKIIAQIDRKKKKTFLQTLKQINELFSRNFSQLSVKGIVTIEPIDKQEVFNAGLDIIVRVGGGKRFDVTSLSGGEQTLVALSLIFSIQEYSPYCFYIFDEIDAALDRRNSEKLAYLLKKHMKQGQYLIITHNDSIISESSSLLYGVSMQDGISKILSLKI